MKGFCPVSYLNVVLGMTPISLGIQISKAETLHLSEVNLSYWTANFSGYKVCPWNKDKRFC